MGIDEEYLLHSMCLIINTTSLVPVRITDVVEAVIADAAVSVMGAQDKTQYHCASLVYSANGY